MMRWQLYIAKLIKKRAAKVALIPRPVDDEVETTVTETLLSETPLYAEPPTCEYPGPPAAPTFWVLEPAVKQAVTAQPAEVVVTRKRVCGRCKRELRDDEVGTAVLTFALRYLNH